MENIILRQARPQDLDALWALNGALLEVQYERAFYDSLCSDQDMVCVCAWTVSGELAGAATARSHETDTLGTWVNEVLFGQKEAYVCTLGVDAAHRRKGLASALLRWLSDFVQREWGCTALALHVLANNDAARRLYAGCGFVELATLSNHYHFDEKWHAAVYMKKQLAEADGLCSKLLAWLPLPVQQFLGQQHPTGKSSGGNTPSGTSLGPARLQEEI